MSAEVIRLYRKRLANRYLDRRIHWQQSNTQNMWLLNKICTRVSKLSIWENKDNESTVTSSKHHRHILFAVYFLYFVFSRMRYLLKESFIVMCCIIIHNAMYLSFEVSYPQSQTNIWHKRLIWKYRSVYMRENTIRMVFLIKMKVKRNGPDGAVSFFFPFNSIIYISTIYIYFYNLY